MKFICEKSILTETIANVMKAVSSKTTLPVLEGILIECTSEGLTLTGYDLEIGITTKIKAEVIKEGKLVLPAFYFYNIIRKMPGDKVSISVDEKLRATIESGNSSFQILGIDAEEYPALPDIEDSDNFTLEASTLKNMIDMTLFAVATVDTRPVQTGALFDIKDGEIRLVAVDGFRLALRKEKIKREDLRLEFVVPGKSLAEISRLIDNQSFEDDEITVHFAENHIVVEIDDYKVISRLLEGKFLIYESSIPSSSTTDVVLNTKEMIESIERTSLLITERLKSPLRMEFLSDKIAINCVTSLGRSYDEVPCSLNGQEVVMGFNHRYLLDAFKNSGEEKVILETSGPLSPVKITSMDHENFIYIVLPLRLRNEED